jgi:hypothetical protein
MEASGTLLGVGQNESQVHCFVGSMGTICITHLRGHEVIVSIERTSRQARHILGEEVTPSKKREPG